tara:strand:+ start:423 stop:767 length:345 start_codon:yes stop_codon:yes gene_type:complete
MNNTEKKLDALIDALGFDVEEVSKVYINGVMYCGNESLIPVSTIDNIVHTIDYKLTKRDEPVEDKAKTHMWMGSHAISMDEYERDYGYMAQIKGLVKESGIPKSVIIDLIQGIL